MGKRHQARELALKVLFQLESSEDDPEEVLRYHAAEGAATSDVAHFAGQLVRGVMANQEKLDGILSATSEHWKARADGQGGPNSSTHRGLRDHH